MTWLERWGGGMGGVNCKATSIYLYCTGTVSDAKPCRITTPLAPTVLKLGLYMLVINDTLGLNKLILGFYNHGFVNSFM